MQKYAAHGALWLSSDVLTELVEKSAFREITVQKVDGHTAWEWRADDLGDTAPRGACTPTEH
jgi:hypothetical protein